jgi:hypothetical protein
LGSAASVLPAQKQFGSDLALQMKQNDDQWLSPGASVFGARGKILKQKNRNGGGQNRGQLYMQK